MAQGALLFQYAEEKNATGLTGLAGLAAYLELWQAAGLSDSVRHHLGDVEKGQGWTGSQMVLSLVLLNLAGGECVDDLRLLEQDEGLGRILRLAETHGMRRRSAGPLRGGGVGSAAVVFPPPLRFSGSWPDSTTKRRRRARGSLIPRSSRPPAKASWGWAGSTPTWRVSSKARLGMSRPPWTWTRL